MSKQNFHFIKWKRWATKTEWFFIFIRLMLTLLLYLKWSHRDLRFSTSQSSGLILIYHSDDSWMPSGIITGISRITFVRTFRKRTVFLNFWLFYTVLPHPMSSIHITDTLQILIFESIRCNISDYTHTRLWNRVMFVNTFWIAASSIQYPLATNFPV